MNGWKGRSPSRSTLDGPQQADRRGSEYEMLQKGIAGRRPNANETPPVENLLAQDAVDMGHQALIDLFRALGREAARLDHESHNHGANRTD